MPINDSQLFGLLQLFVEQQKDIIRLKASLISMARILEEEGVQMPQTRIVKMEEEILKDPKNFDGSRVAIESIEKVMAQLLPTTGTKN